MEGSYLVFLKNIFRKLFFNERKEYDLFIPIGDGCVTTQALRDLGLQIRSYPLDWLGMAVVSLDSLLTLLETKLAFIFDELIEEYRYENLVAYKNSFGMVFNHDFFAKYSLEQQLPGIKEKYDRRIRRLFEHIKNSESVCFVYVQALNATRPNCRQYAKKDTLKFANKLKERFFGKSIKVVFIAHNPNLKRDDILFSKESGCLEFVEISNYYIHRHYDWKVNYDILLKVLSRYRLNLSLKVQV